MGIKGETNQSHSDPWWSELYSGRPSILWDWGVVVQLATSRRYPGDSCWRIPRRTRTGESRLGMTTGLLVENLDGERRLGLLVEDSSAVGWLRLVVGGRGLPWVGTEEWWVWGWGRGWGRRDWLVSGVCHFSSLGCLLLGRRLFVDGVLHSSWGLACASADGCWSGRRPGEEELAVAVVAVLVMVVVREFQGIPTSTVTVVVRRTGMVGMMVAVVEDKVGTALNDHTIVEVVGTIHDRAVGNVHGGSRTWY